MHVHSTWPTFPRRGFGMLAEESRDWRASPDAPLPPPEVRDECSQGSANGLGYGP